MLRRLRRKLPKITFFVSALLFSGVARAQSAFDPSSLVDPFIGTSTSWINDVANTVPGATMPFGMLYWSPDRTDGTFYRYEGTTTRGFSLNHLSGPGCSVYGDVPILPILGGLSVPPPVRSQPYQASYKPEDQIAEPGYYGVKLASGIGMQLVAAVRSGIATIEFPPSSEPRTILVDLSRNMTRVNDAAIFIRGKSVGGWVASDEFCGNENHYRVYFWLEVDQTPESSGTFNELGVKAGSESESGPRAGGYLMFSAGTRTLHLKAGLSYVSVENAALNMKQELPAWDFDGARQNAHTRWNEALGHIHVAGGTKAQQKIFYTALYHSLLHPSAFSDVNGEFTGFDGQVHKAERRVQYANFSGWDIYRTQIQLISMLFPDVASDMAQSLVVDAEQGGGLPIWPVANDESGVMVGDPGALIVANIYAFGGRHFDTHQALTAMVKGADDPLTHVRVYPERPGLQDYLSKGYVVQRPESPGTSGAASVTLEDTSADFAISQFAKDLRDNATWKRYLLRSANWRKLFDSETKYIRARDQNGQFLPEFSPAKTDGFVEGNAAQYTWMVPYDLGGVIDAVGGPEAAKARLDDYFSEYGRWTGSGYTPHFFLSNEPSFGNPWIYNWTRHSWRTQEVVRKSLQDLFIDGPGGIPGNDDLGATSSWAIFGFLGIYPEIPGVGGFTLNTPTFPEVTVKLAGHDLHIRAVGAPEMAYIQSVSLDGKAVRNFWIDWDQMSEATELRFVLSQQPDRSTWDVPPSFAISKPK